MTECEHSRVGREFLDSVSWPILLRRPAHDQCYCHQCYSSDLPDTLTVAGYTYVIPRGWSRFAVSVDEDFFNHHNVWKTWLNCYHGTSIDNARSCVEHRQLLLPNDITMYGKKLEIREDHIPGEQYVFTTPSIKYAALGCYGHTYDFRSPHDSKLYTIKVVLQCKQKPDSIIVQPETVGAREREIKICPHFPNEVLEWKTKHRSSVMIYGLLLQVKGEDAEDDSNLSLCQSINITENQPHESIIIPPQSASSNENVDNNPKSSPSNEAINNNSKPTRSIASTYRSKWASMSRKRAALLIILVVSTFLPIAALIIGQVYKNDCPMQPWIPRWLIIFGAMGLAGFSLIFITMSITFQRCSKDTEVGNDIGSYMFCLLILFFLAWLIAGSVWIFPANLEVQFNETNKKTYCHKTLYKFAFGLSLVQYSLIGVLVCCCLGNVF
ncbi:unnamed protein product [Adineta ricciae]|uniref:Uncharacterized protein n=1 Tax=Adineta ricciae TaxID=249248 RepID=A0A814HYH0_ADIRI|nr:unnamed protein product [Adineta ricciae]CAF1035894.1 unnamed protein product [Adineta ricciae]